MSAECPFEVHGYWEEFACAATFRFLGTRLVEKPERSCGSPGTVEMTLTEPVALRRGFKSVTLKASKEKPVRVLSTFQMICGRVKNNNNRKG